MRKFELGGHNLSVDDNREAYNTLRLKYQALAAFARSEFVAAYSTFTSIDDIHQRFFDIARTRLAPVIDVAIRDLVESGIYDVNDAAFLDRYVSRYHEWERRFEEVERPYLAIVMNSAEAEAHRVARKQNRGRVIGGGFGAEGAVRGAVGAWEANVALGALHGIANSMGRAASNVSDRRKKEALFNDPSTQSYLADAVYQLTFDVHFAVVDATHEHGANIYQPVSEADGAKASALLENVTKGRIPTEEAADRVLDALWLDPYEDRAYLIWLERHGDHSAQLSEIARHFGVNSVAKTKARLLDDKKRSLRFTTPEECSESLQALLAYAATLGVQDIDGYRREINTLSIRLDIERRTFGGKLFDTLAEAKSARAVQEEELRRTVDGKLYNNHDEAEAARVQKAEIDSIQRRTVKGIVYESDEAAVEARKFDHADAVGLVFATFATLVWIGIATDASVVSYIVPMVIGVTGVAIANKSRKKRAGYANIWVIAASIAGMGVCIAEGGYRSRVSTAETRTPLAQALPVTPASTLVQQEISTPPLANSSTLPQMHKDESPDSAKNTSEQASSSEPIRADRPIPETESVPSVLSDDDDQGHNFQLTFIPDHTSIDHHRLVKYAPYQNTSKECDDLTSEVETVTKTDENGPSFSAINSSKALFTYLTKEDDLPMVYHHLIGEFVHKGGRVVVTSEQCEGEAHRSLVEVKQVGF